MSTSGGAWARAQVGMLEFSRERKMMSVRCARQGHPDTLFVKGAPEAVLARCTHVRPWPVCPTSRACMLTCHASRPLPVLSCLQPARRTSSRMGLAHADRRCVL